MPAGQRSGTGALTDLEDEKVRKNDILSNRDKSQRPPGHGLDGKGTQVDEYKDTPANRRVRNPDNPVASDTETSDTEASDTEADAPTPREQDQGTPKEPEASEKIDRPGFDLGGSTGKTQAGRGLGLGPDAVEDGKDSRLPRE